MLHVELTLPTGESWDLTGTPSSSQVLAPLGVLEPLVGGATRTDVPLSGRSGVLPGRPRFGPIQAEVEFLLQAENGAQMEALYNTFRRGWRLWDPRRRPAGVTFRVTSAAGLSWLLDAWLDRPLQGVPVDMSRRTSASLVVPLFEPVGLFRSEPQSASGLVEVVNFGDEVIYPRISYSGEGGEVTSPSGAVFGLPVVSSRMVIDLDPMRLRLEGAFPEGVEPGEVGVWSLPAGAELIWEVLVADPWA